MRQVGSGAVQVEAEGAAAQAVAAGQAAPLIDYEHGRAVFMQRNNQDMSQMMPSVGCHLDEDEDVSVGGGVATTAAAWGKGCDPASPASATKAFTEVTGTAGWRLGQGLKYCVICTGAAEELMLLCAGCTSARAHRDCLPSTIEPSRWRCTSCSRRSLGDPGSASPLGSKRAQAEKCGECNACLNPKRKRACLQVKHGGG